MYACLILLIHDGILPRHPAGPFEDGEVATVRILYSLLAHLVSFFALAYLATHLAESLRRTDQELQMRQDDLAELRAFNDNIIDSINSGNFIFRLFWFIFDIMFNFPKRGFNKTIFIDPRITSQMTN